MKKPLVKALLWLAGGLLALAAIYWLVVILLLRSFLSDIGEILFGSAEPERVELLAAADAQGLASGRYALILDDFVTGAGPRLITDPAELARLAPDLWYQRESNAGTGVINAVGLSLGAPPLREIGSLLQGTTTIASFTCLTVVCGTWPDSGADNPAWGMGGFRSSPLPGQKVEKVTGHFENYDAYLIAHKSIAADGSRWFATPGGETPEPPDTGLRRIDIDLPAALVSLQSPASLPSADSPDAGARDMKALLERHARAWLGEEAAPGEASPGETSPGEASPGETSLSETSLNESGPGDPGRSGGRVLSIRVSPAMPLWVMRDGVPLQDASGSRALPDLGWRERSITLEVPEARLEEVTARIDTRFAEPPDLLRIADAVHSAFIAWGLDASCLPGCGGADLSRIMLASSYVISPKPSWSITSWRILPDPVSD